MVSVLLFKLLFWSNLKQDVNISAAAAAAGEPLVVVTAAHEVVVRAADVVLTTMTKDDLITAVGDFVTTVVE